MLPQEILNLSVPEKLRFVQELWDDIAAHPEGLNPSAEQELELSRRFAAHENEPESGISSEQAFEKLRGIGFEP